MNEERVPEEDRDKTLPKKGLLPELPQNIHDTGSLKPEMVPTDSSVAASIQKVQETFRVATDASLEKAIKIVAEQPNLDYMSAEEIESRLVYTFQKETTGWLEKFRETGLIKQMVIEGRKKRMRGEVVDFNEPSTKQNINI